MIQQCDFFNGIHNYSVAMNIISSITSIMSQVAKHFYISEKFMKSIGNNWNKTMLIQWNWNE